MQTKLIWANPSREKVKKSYLRKGAYGYHDDCALAVAWRSNKRRPTCLFRGPLHLNRLRDLSKFQRDQRRGFGMDIRLAGMIFLEGHDRLRSSSFGHEPSRRLGNPEQEAELNARVSRLKERWQPPRPARVQVPSAECDPRREYRTCAAEELDIRSSARATAENFSTDSEIVTRNFLT